MLTAGTPVRHYSARELLECAEREVKIRQRVYANRVLTHRMSQHQADVEIARMEAIAAWLKREAEKERLI
jgi:uncharacterized membrane protein